MIPLLLMLASADAPAMTPVDAERAFAADAKTIGQWTAFRKWSTDDAVMFVPQPTNAHEFLKDRKDPPKVIDWWPTASYISCDGSLAVNTGGWTRPDGAVGYFSTVWQLQRDGSWRWIVDGGDGLKAPRERPAKPKVVHASCTRPSPVVTSSRSEAGSGQSPDSTLTWRWEVGVDGKRRFSAWIASSSGQYIAVINDDIPAPK